MPRPSRSRPTDTELEILRVLWEIGPATVRQVHESMNLTRPIGYTSVLKLMQIMTEKKLLQRDASQRSHVFRPSKTQEHTQGGLVGDLLDRAFDGSASRLVLRALSDRPVSTDELQAIRDMLDELEDAAEEDQS